MSRSVKSRLNEMDLRPSKSRGQNFLIDDSVIATIIEFARIRPGEQLLEIGPGLGALTAELVRQNKLTVIEIEEKFCRDLKARFPNLNIINQDVRFVDFSTIGNELVVFGNLPYSFSTDIIFHLIAYRQSISRAVLMLQREFAERLGAAPGTRDYGVLSISCQLFANVEIGPILSGDSFHPPTKVESALVELKLLKEPRINVGDEIHFREVLNAAFFRRRKKLINSLEASQRYQGEGLEERLRAGGMDPNRRPETLSIREFVQLATILAPAPRL